MKKLFLVDAYALIFKYYYAFLGRPMRNRAGMNTSVVFGFVKFLRDIQKRERPDLLGVAFDPKGGSFRREIFPEYKANRAETPEDILLSVPYVKRVLEAMCIPILEVEGYEADDVIGTLSQKGVEAGYEVFMVTPDKDYGQLVRDNCKIYKQKGAEGSIEIVDREAIREKYGIEPPQLIDVKSLMGDASDNIPGVPGIGEKTALALISKFGSLQGVYDNIDDKAVKPGQRAKLTANRDKADLSYMLGTIRKDAPIETTPAAYLRQPGDPAAAAQLLAALEMHKLVDRWGLNGGTAPAPSENAAPLETVEPSPLPLLLEGRFYAARNADGDWYLVQGHDVYLPDTDRLAGFVGRLNHQKNPLFLMEVFAAMAAQDPHWKLLLVGTGEKEPEMRAAAEAHGLTDRVIFAGVQSDVPAFMNAFDLFLLPSNFEGSPVTLVEAQGCGVPCLASTNVPDDGSVTELVHFLPLAAPLSDWAAKADAIAPGGDHADHWQTLAAAGYELKTAARRMEQLYDKLGGQP